MLILNGLEIRKIKIYRSVTIRHVTRRYNLENTRKLVDPQSLGLFVRI